MIQVGGKDFITLEDNFYANDKKVVAAYANNVLVYPRKTGSLLKIYGELKRNYTKVFEEIPLGIHTSYWSPNRFGIPSYSFLYQVDIRFVAVLKTGNTKIELKPQRSAWGYSLSSSSLDSRYPYNRFEVSNMNGVSYDDDYLNVKCNNPDYYEQRKYDCLMIGDVFPVLDQQVSNIKFKATISPFVPIPEFTGVQFNPVDGYSIVDTYTTSQRSIPNATGFNGDIYTCNYSTASGIGGYEIANTEYTAYFVPQTDQDGYYTWCLLLYAKNVHNDYQVSYNRQRYYTRDGTTINETKTASIPPGTIAQLPITKILYFGENDATAPEWAKDVFDSDLD